MVVGIVGLGLIGGSVAKAYKACGHTVYAYNRTKEVLDTAIQNGFADGFLDDVTASELDLLVLALYPKISIEFYKNIAPKLNENCLTVDCCGIKREICDECFKISSENNTKFIGGHPMAGKHLSGFEYSEATLYKGASMILVPKCEDDTELINEAKEKLAALEFGKFTVTTAQKHDKMIAFTSQLAHVVSNAYIKSPTAKEHDGFSGGSYRDMTRVAYLNEGMWTELFFENEDNLVYEIDNLINELSKYRDALKNNDRSLLTKLLSDGKKCKVEVDG